MLFAHEHFISMDKKQIKKKYKKDQKDIESWINCQRIFLFLIGLNKIELEFL